MQSAETSEQVYSNLADDPDLAEHVDQFVATLPRLFAELADSATRRDWPQLRKTARQIKGSSGCYGFDEVAALAALLDAACPPEGDEKTALQALAELERLGGRVRSKRPPK